MNDYIKRELAVERLEKLGKVVTNVGVAYICAAQQAMDELPPADVAPVVHGHWFFTEYEFFTCSECGGGYYNGAESTAQAESYLNSGFVYKYCPNCGARMDGVQE